MEAELYNLTIIIILLSKQVGSDPSQYRSVTGTHKYGFFAMSWESRMKGAEKYIILDIIPAIAR